MTSHNKSNKEQSVDTDRRKALSILGVLGIGGVAAASVAEPANANAATIARTDVANALGFYPIISDDAPSTTSIGNVPVVWFEKNHTITNIPAIPIAPYFDSIKAQYYLSKNVVGIQYQNADTGAILKQDAFITVPSGVQTVKIKAVALPGYVLASGVPTSWTHTFFTGTVGQTVIMSDTYSNNSSGTALDLHTPDNKLGGTITNKYVQFWTQDGKKDSNNRFITNGFSVGTNNTLTNTGLGWYYLNTTVTNFRVEFDFKWLTTDDVSGMEVSIGATGDTDNMGGINLMLMDSGWRLYCPTISGNPIIASSNSGSHGDDGNDPSGHYILEIFNNQVGYKTPLMSVMQYQDVTYVDNYHGIPDKDRGTYTCLRSDATQNNAFSISNLKITKLGS